MSPRCAWVLLSACAVTATVLAGTAGPSMDRYTIDGGGATRSVAGNIELTGTIGQPDAGVVRAETIELTGGFWFGLEPNDCNSDGLVNLFDFSAMRACLSGPAENPSPACRCFDADGSGVIDLRDFASFQVVFDGP